MKMVKSLLLVASCVALIGGGAAIAAPLHAAGPGPLSISQGAPGSYVGDFDANGMIAKNIILVASDKQIAQRQKFANCAHAWAAYKAANSVSGRSAYRAYMSACLKPPVPTPPPAPQSRHKRS